MRTISTIIDQDRDIQLNFEHILFPDLLPEVKYRQMDRAIREAVRLLNKMNIPTNSSEGGGGQKHGAPDYAYIEAKLSKDNIEICQKLDILLDKISRRSDSKNYLFHGSARAYSRDTGYFVIGFNRKKLSDRSVKDKFKYFIKKLEYQGKPRGSEIDIYV